MLLCNGGISHKCEVCNLILVFVQKKNKKKHLSFLICFYLNQICKRQTYIFSLFSSELWNVLQEDGWSPCHLKNHHGTTRGVTIGGTQLRRFCIFAPTMAGSFLGWKVKNSFFYEGSCNHSFSQKIN